MTMDVSAGALDLEMKPQESYQEDVPDLKRLRSDESVVDGEKLGDDVDDDDDCDDDDEEEEKLGDVDDDDDEEEEKLRLKQKEMDAIDAAEFADFCQFIDENTIVYPNGTYRNDPVDIKQRELDELEELEALKVFEKIRNGTLSNNAGYCPVCKKKNYNCDHYHYNKRWKSKSYSLISCFICRSKGEHMASGCPHKHDKGIHPIWGGRY